MRDRYTWVAPLYDVLSLERPVYRTGRVAGIPLLGLSEGATVLDVGCGTGLNVPLLLDGVGASGRVIGVDSSADMLRVARRNVPGGAADRVTLVEADATRMGDLGSGVSDLLGAGPGAILSTYALSLMHPWQDAWESITALARDGTRIVVVDMAVPTGRGRWLTPLARLACRVAGADIGAHPWTRLAAECTDVTHLMARAGHVQIWAGTWSGRPSASGPRPFRGSTGGHVDVYPGGCTGSIGRTPDVSNGENS